MRLALWSPEVVSCGWKSSESEFGPKTFIFLKCLSKQCYAHPWYRKDICKWYFIIANLYLKSLHICLLLRHLLAKTNEMLSISQKFVCMIIALYQPQHLIFPHILFWCSFFKTNFNTSGYAMQLDLFRILKKE